METIKVEATTKESKQAQGKTYWGVKSGGVWFNVITDSKPAMGATINGEVKTSEWNNKTYRWLTPTQAQAAPQQAGASSNGHIAWEDYEAMAHAAHDMAMSMEPDSVNEADLIDRSTARAAIVNTVMIAFANGKLALPKDEPPPPADDDNIPF